MNISDDAWGETFSFTYDGKLKGNGVVSFGEIFSANINQQPKLSDITSCHVGTTFSIGSQVDTEVENIISKSRKAFGAEESATKFDSQKYLTAYEHLYGVKRSNFIYKLPYLEDGYKEVNNNWGTGEGTLNQTTTEVVNKIKNAFTFAAPCVGIDYAKSFQYSDS